MLDERYATMWETGGPASGLSKLSAAYVVIDPGKTSPGHWHAKTEELYAIVFGKGIVHLGGRNKEVTAGECISIPVETVHAIGAHGTEPLVLWVITSPPYTENDDFEV